MSNEEDRSYESNGYNYKVNESGQITYAGGDLRKEPGERNSYAQRTAGGEYRHENDDGGHLIGARFGGSGGRDNIVAEERTVNRGSYKSLENWWAEELDKGKNVHVDVEPVYHGESIRPDVITAKTEITSDDKTMVDYYSATNENLQSEEFQIPPEVDEMMVQDEENDWDGSFYGSEEAVDFDKSDIVSETYIDMQADTSVDASDISEESNNLSEDSFDYNSITDATESMDVEETADVTDPMGLENDNSILDATESMDAADVTDSMDLENDNSILDATESMDVAEAVDVTDSMDLENDNSILDATESMDVAEAVDVTDSMDLGNDNSILDATESIDVTETVDITDSMDLGNDNSILDATDSVDLTEAMDVTNSIDLDNTIDLGNT